ncbi:MAG TPA: efflux RND transporter periplasmic adaptor subunit [Kofleriaceae bacterium]|nr:efflux RND transporter periplasmic adaptor subunit [Kofleriaceae bacterium]
MSRTLASLSNRSILAALVLASAAGVAGVAGCGSRSSADDAAAPADPVVEIPLATVEQKPAPDLLTLTGTVAADQESDVAASVPGKVVRVYVDRGAKVKFGEPLVALDAQSAALSAQSVRAQLAAAKAQQQMAQDECKRSQALLDKGAITQSQYEHEQTSCTAAEQTVAATKAQLDLVSKSIADGVVRAPFAGIIADKFVSPGEWVGPGVRLVSLVDDDPLKVELSVPERWVPRVALGQAVEVSAIAYPDQKFPAKVTRIGAEIGRQNRALTVEAELAPGSSLRPGMFTEAHLTLGATPMAVVPKTALVQRGSTWRLFVVVKGHLEERVVQLGPELADGKVALLRGAVPGDKVAATITERVTDGVRVQ